MNDQILYPNKPKKGQSAREKANSVYGTLYVLCILGFSIPTIVELVSNGEFNANMGMFILKISSLFTLLTRPFSLIPWSTSGATTLFNDVFNQDGTIWADIESRFSEVVGAETTFNSYITVPTFVFFIPLVFYFIASFYLGYRTKPQKNIAVEGFEFAAGNYLMSLGFYVVIWGIVGIFNGFWDLSFVLVQLFSTWFSGWMDFLLMIIVAVILGAAGKWAAGQRPPSSKPAAEYLVGSLQKPTPRYSTEPAVVQQARLSPSPVEVEVPEPSVPTASAPAIAMYCEYCGAKIDSRARFCAGCGVSLEELVLPEPEPVAGQAPPSSEQAPEQAPVQARATVEIPVAAAAPSPAADADVDAGEAGKNKKKKTPEISPGVVDEMERRMMDIDRVSIRFSIIMMGISVVYSIICLALGWVQGFAYGLLSLPLGFMAMMKDRDVFSKWVFERNYASRGVDLIMWGLIGTLCAGSGLLLFAKGVLMLLITQNRKDEYPRMKRDNWQARVFQASSTAASSLVLGGTILGISNIFTTIPFFIIWSVIATFLGFMSWLMYTRIVKPEFARGNIYSVEVPVFIAGIIGMVAGGAGVLILLQGALIATKKEQYRLEEGKATEETDPANAE